MPTHVTDRLVAAVLALALLGLGSCAGKSVYVPAGSVTQSADFSDTDMRMMAGAMYASLQKRLTQISPADARPPVVALVHLANKTSEHIDTNAIADKLQIEMIKAGTLRFVDRSKLHEAVKEFDLGGSGMVNPESAKRAGNVTGADFLLMGDIGSIIKTSGRTQLSFYRLSMRMMQVETNELVWADEFEIKKSARKGVLDW
jgi:hypothetical protein